MEAYQCKMCGGSLVPQADGATGVCEYCGTVLTLPRGQDERLQSTLNRANAARMACDFDRAIREYERAISQSDQEPEAYWGLTLSKFGVEFVKDPATGQFRPTLHRLSPRSVLEDPDYLNALQHADVLARSLYQQAAEEIDAAMRRCLELSARETPYDIFISYKKEEDGVRTQDSYFAHDLYNKLTGAGYRVFFAQETLQRAIGEEYEPKIYSALMSAKVMLVIGTKEAYFNAVWVKNEWSRFAEMIERGEEKVLITVYDNFNVGRLPKRLSRYQALQKSDLNFLNTLMETLSRVIRPHTQESEAFDQVRAALERGALALEDGQFADADAFFENALNADPHSAAAYFGKLLAELRARTAEEIVAAERPLAEYGNFEKALRFADEGFRMQLLGYENQVQNRLIRNSWTALQASFASVNTVTGYEKALENLAVLRSTAVTYGDPDTQALVPGMDAVERDLQARRASLVSQIERSRMELEQQRADAQQAANDRIRAERERLEKIRQKKLIGTAVLYSVAALTVLVPLILILTNALFSLSLRSFTSNVVTHGVFVLMPYLAGICYRIGRRVEPKYAKGLLPIGIVSLLAAIVGCGLSTVYVFTPGDFLALHAYWGLDVNRSELTVLVILTGVLSVILCLISIAVLRVKKPRPVPVQRNPYAQQYPPRRY